MDDGLFVTIIVVSAILMAYLAWLIFTRWRRASHDRGRLQWLHAQLERALEQINSDEEQEILAGFQILAILKDPRMRVRALERINVLTGSDNPVVAKHARLVYARILEELSDLAAPPLKKPVGSGEDVSTIRNVG